MQDPIFGKVRQDEQPKVVREVKKQKVRLASKRIRPGQNLFKYSRKDGTLEKVDLAQKAETEIHLEAVKGGPKAKVNKYTVEEGMVYVIALNMKNAVRKLKKRGIVIEL